MARSSSGDRWAARSTMSSPACERSRPRPVPPPEPRGPSPRRHAAVVRHAGLPGRDVPEVNPGVELVSSDPIMDPLRGVKEPAEIATMTTAQRIAGIGMDRARSLLGDGATGHDIATRGDIRHDAGRGRTDQHADLRQRRSRDLHAPWLAEPATDAGRRPRRHRPDAGGRRLLREPGPGPSCWASPTLASARSSTHTRHSSRSCVRRCARNDGGPTRFRAPRPCSASVASPSTR